METMKAADETTRIRMAADPYLPPEAQQALLLVSFKRPSARLATLKRLAANPGVDPQILRALARVDNYDIEMALASHPNTPDDVLLGLIRKDEQLLLGRISRREVPLSWILWRQLLRHDSLLPDLMRRQEAPTQALDYVLDRHTIVLGDVMSLVAAHPNLARPQLERLISSPLEGVRGNIAQRSDLTPKDVQQLSRDEKAAVRAALAANPLCTPDVLHRLADDPTFIVQERVAANKHTEPAVLRRLAETATPIVLSGLASNPSTPPDVVDKLALMGDERTIRILRNRTDLSDMAKTLVTLKI